MAQKFRVDLDEIHRTLIAVPPTLADLPWREGGWTRRQIVGHLLDSATNNRQRFVRAAIDGQYAGPKYAQNAWVDAHGYANQPWGTLLNWWEAEHEILMAAVDNIPEDRFAATCMVGDEPPVSLRYLIDDYVVHQRWHLKQITTGIAGF
jgi:hypothetical protein